jgi:trehalose 6-phosphate synthase/phosphatase
MGLYQSPEGMGSSLETDYSWKRGLCRSLERYTARCKGSFVEEKRASLSWHYRNADEDLATLRAHELKNEIESR